MVDPLPGRTPSPASAPASRTRRGRRILRRLALALALLVGLLAVIGGAGWLWLRNRIQASLPQLSGESELAGLAAPVEIERDGQGVPTIHASGRADAVRALGFLHAQDRFFQMDLLRRQAAGELSEILGPALLEADRSARVHRFRERARRVLVAASPEVREILAAYTGGVNAGLSALGEKPFEYLALRADPAPWRAEDSILILYAMFFELNDGGAHEARLARLHDSVPREVFDFLAPAGTEWDAPIVGAPFETPPIPGPEVFDLRKRPALPRAASLGEPAWEASSISVTGSNNWALSGARTADGRAWIANDMHLAVRVPNIWYRFSVVRPGGAGARLRLAGVSLPGSPVLVVGSNGHVAWGFSNSYGDWSDLLVLEVDPKDPETYRTPQGPKRFRIVKEQLKVKGGEAETLEVKETIWGPVIEPDHRGRPRALAWIAHHLEAVNLKMLDLETAATVEEAMAVANRSGIPPQNFVVADDSGGIGWTIIGRVPRRAGFDGKLPTSWADGSRRWAGWLAPEEVPRVVNPPSGLIWTANNRVADGDMLAKLGDGGYILGARGRQVRDGLMKLDKAKPADLLAVQLDDRALLIERWRDLLLRTLDPDAVRDDPRRRELRRLVETTWTGRASVDSAAYRAARAFRNYLTDQVFTSLTNQGGVPKEQRFGPPPQFEGPLWKMVDERPPHLLDPRFKSWDEQFLSAVDAVLELYASQGPNLADRTWGERNRSRIQHPLSQAVPFLSRWLDVPPRPLPGDEDMPRVQGRAHGASERLAVSPGQEETGFFHMPVGQSGHPLSPYYRKGHEAWEEGRPTPFLPGPGGHRLRLVPQV